VAVLVVATLAAVNGYYFHRSRTPTFWDDAGFLRGSLMLFDGLRDHGIIGFARTFSHLFGIRPPLISALPVPFYVVFGREFDPRFLIGAGFVILISIYLFRIAESFWSPKEGLLAVAILQTMPVPAICCRVRLGDPGGDVDLLLSRAACVRGLADRTPRLAARPRLIDEGLLSLVHCRPGGGASGAGHSTAGGLAR
jgi:hypothetical protein